MRKEVEFYYYGCQKCGQTYRQYFITDKRWGYCPAHAEAFDSLLDKANRLKLEGNQPAALLIQQELLNNWNPSPAQRLLIEQIK